MTKPCIHGETSGCFDCMVGGTNPTTKPLPKKKFKAPRKGFMPIVHGEAIEGARTYAPGQKSFFGVQEEREDTRTDEDAVREDGREVDVDPLFAVTDKQRSFIRTLESERMMPADVRQRLMQKLDTFDKRKASEVIAWLLNQPKKGSVVQPALPTPNGKPLLAPSEASIARQIQASVPAGRYAITIGDVTKFYRVDKPGADSKWAGRTFVSIQASDDFFPIKDGVMRHEILKAIAVDPKAAMLLYGMKLGKCGHCGRTLTDEASRERGIGPICAAKMEM